MHSQPKAIKPAYSLGLTETRRMAEQESWNALKTTQKQSLRDWLLSVEIVELLKERGDSQLLDKTLTYLEEQKIKDQRWPISIWFGLNF
jgi:hypothetical protein